MAVVDSSAIIPLARSGNLYLLEELFGTVYTVEKVRDETVQQGKRGSSTINGAFGELIRVEEPDSEEEKIPELENVGKVDARIILLAEEREEILLANDRALIKVARARGVESIWPTTVVMKSVKRGVIQSEEGKSAIRQMVSEGMNLSTVIYDRVIRKIESYD
ncbi:MAG: hypothetical protein ABEJ56_05045 [Candidatus Nanohaloarchaea archaeon]